MTYEKKNINAEHMRGRASRTQSGTLRELRDDTYVRTIEEHYDVDFGVRGDMQWGTLKEHLGVSSIKEALKQASSRGE